MGIICLFCLIMITRGINIVDNLDLIKNNKQTNSQSLFSLRLRSLKKSNVDKKDTSRIIQSKRQPLSSVNIISNASRNKTVNN